MWIFEARTGAVIAANDAATRAYGYTREELFACRVQDICPARHANGALVMRSAPNGPAPWAGPLVQRRKDGTTFDAEVATVETGGASEHATMVIVYPITNARVQATPTGPGLASPGATVTRIREDDAPPSSKTLLGRPKAVARLLERDDGGGPLPLSPRELSDTLEGPSSELAALSGDASPFVAVDPKELTQQVAARLRWRAEAKGVRLVIYCTCSTVWLRPASFSKAVRELLDNAIEASRAGDQVFIDIRETADGDALWQIQDWGVGMSRQTLADLGQPRHSMWRPAGFGVARAWAIVENHGGLLRFESTAGVGTTASIWLPRRGSVASEDSAVLMQPSDDDR